MPDLAHIRELATNAPDGRDPLTALEFTRAMRRALDALEQEAVAQAHGSGATWEEIGAALGISRQSAHERHASRLRRPNP